MRDRCYVVLSHVKIVWRRQQNAKSPLYLPPVQVHRAGPEDCDCEGGVCGTHDSKVGCVEHMIQRWGVWNTCFKGGVCGTHDSKVGCMGHMIQWWGLWNT